MLRAKDQTQQAIGSFKQSISGLKATVVGLASSFAVGALIRNIDEAQKATAQLDTAYGAMGRTVGLTRDRLDDLATSLQKTTTVGDDLVKEAQSILLTFDRVRGQAFERTIRVANDLSARMGTDLVSNAQALGRALQDPERGLQQLTRIGITFTDAQRDLIRELNQSGRAFEAQNIILAEVEKRFRGSAEAARNTLGGAIAALKNQIGDLFEGDAVGGGALTNAINGVTEALSDPNLKKGLDTLITGIAKVAEVSVKAVGALGQAAQKAQELARSEGAGGGYFRGVIAGSPVLRGIVGIFGDDEPAARRRGGRPAGSFQSGHSAIGAEEIEAISQVEEVKIDLRRRELNADEQYFQQLDALSQTATERQVARYHEIVEAARTLRNEGVISQEQFQARQGEALDELLPEFDLDKIRSLYKEVKAQTDETSALIRGAWERAGGSIQQTLKRAFDEGKISARSLLDVVRSTVNDILAALLTSGIKKAFASLFTNSNDTSSQFGNAFMTALGFAGFGGAAGGGQINRPTWVGENGMELAVPGVGGARIYNKAQLAGMGLGGNTINYAPSFAIQIEAKDAEETEARLAQYLEIRLAQNNKELSRMLGRNGVQLK